MGLRAPGKKPRGRPPKPDSERRRSNLTLRIRDETKAALAMSAWGKGRSISEEAEGLIELALQSKTMLDQALDLTLGRQFTGLVLTLARVMRTTANYAWSRSAPRPSAPREPADLLANPFVFDQAARAAARVFEILRPKDEIVQPAYISILKKAGMDLRAKAEANLGGSLANDILLRIATTEGGSEEFEEWAAQIRAKLGSDVMQRILDNMGDKADANG